MARAASSRAVGVRRRRGGPLRQHGRGRAGGLRRGGHRLGAHPGVRAAVSDVPMSRLRRRQPGDRGGRHDRRRWPTSPRPTPRSPGPGGPSRRWRRGRARPTGRGCCAASPSAVDAAPSRSSRSSRSRNSGHTIGNARWEAGNVRDVLDLLLRRRRSGCSAGRSRWPAASTSPSTSRSASSASSCRGTSRCRSPAGAFAPGAGRRQHRRAQARRADPADRDPARPSWRWRPGCPRACSGAARQGLGGRAAARRAPRRRARSCSPARPRSASAIMAGCARAGQAGDPRARRQERQHRLRRRRPRAGRGDRAVRRLRQRRAGLLRPVADPGRSARRYDRFLELLEPAVHGRAGRGPGARRPPRWAR